MLAVQHLCGWVPCSGALAYSLPRRPGQASGICVCSSAKLAERKGRQQGSSLREQSRPGTHLAKQVVIHALDWQAGSQGRPCQRPSASWILCSAAHEELIYAQQPAPSCVRAVHSKTSSNEQPDGRLRTLEACATGAVDDRPTEAPLLLCTM